MNNKSQSGFAMTIFSLIVLTSSALLGNNLTLNGSIIPDFSSDSIEKIIEVSLEVWADTLIELELNQDNFSTTLLLDNQTLIPEQEVYFYLDEILIAQKITDSQGHTQTDFNLFNESPGTHSLRVNFQGNHSLFLNPSLVEKQFEIIEVNGTKEIKIIEPNITLQLDENLTLVLNETNHSLLTIYTYKNYYVQNETINIFGEIINLDVDEVVLKIKFNETPIFNTRINSINKNYKFSLIADFESEGRYIVEVSAGNLSAQTSFYFSKINYTFNLDKMICREFTDNVLFSSGYSQKPKGSTNYDTWYLEHNCSEAGGQDCSLYNVNTKSRVLYVNLYDEEVTGEGYAQISELDASDCSNPEKEEYTKYVVYDTPSEESDKNWKRYCEKNRISDSKCGIENSENYYEESRCYGVKTYAPQYSIVDVVEISYTWCWEDVR